MMPSTTKQRVEYPEIAPMHNGRVVDAPIRNQCLTSNFPTDTASAHRKSEDLKPEFRNFDLFFELPPHLELLRGVIRGGLTRAPRAADSDAYSPSSRLESELAGFQEQ